MAKRIDIPEKNERIDLIFSKLRETDIPEELYERIGGWLLDEENSEEKEVRLSELFSDMFVYEKHPRKRAYEMWNDFMRMNNIQPERQIRPPHRKRLIVRYAAVAAVLIAGIVLSVLLLNERDPDAFYAEPLIMLSVPAGESREITFADGSKALLSEGTQINYPEDFERERSVTLEGKARFNVTKGDSFSVNTKFFTIMVLGTEFVVDLPADEDHAHVLLYSGSLSVESSSQKIIMSPGQELYYDGASGIMTISRMPINEVSYESMPGLVFEDVPIAEIFEMIEKEYGIPFRIEGDISSIRSKVRGDFSHIGSIDKFMHILQVVSGEFSYEITDDCINVKINS